MRTHVKRCIYMPSSVIPRSHFYPSAESSCGNTVQTDSPAGDKTAPCIFVDRKSNLCKTKRALKRFTNNATGCLSVAYSLINAMSVDSVFAIMNVYMEFAIMSVCSEFAIMSVGTTLSLQIRNNSIIITATSCSAAISAAESGKSPIGNMETNSITASANCL